jgi:two-component system response regulator YesN
MTPGEFLLRLRIGRAKDLLLNHPELRISEISSLVGHGDANLFSRVFRRCEGESPSQFRKRHGC